MKKADTIATARLAFQVLGAKSHDSCKSEAAANDWRRYWRGKGLPNDTVSSAFAFVLAAALRGDRTNGSLKILSAAAAAEMKAPP